MVKTKKKFYYPTMLYYPVRKTKKITKVEDFNYTYGRNFKPSDLMEPPKKNINFNKTDDISKFISNTLDLYNIDFNPNFLDFTLNNFQQKLGNYLNIVRGNDFYLGSISKIKAESDLKELKTVLNEHELHLILEGLDFLLTMAKQNKRQFSLNIKSNTRKLLNNSKIQKGGYIRKFDIIAFLNGDKRKDIKKRICDFVYLTLSEEEALESKKKIPQRRIRRRF